MQGVGVLRTITLGSCVLIQGILEKTLADGRIVVRVGKRLYAGKPI